MTPTQKAAYDRRKAFRALIEARAVTQKQSPEKPQGIRGYNLHVVEPSASEMTVELPDVPAPAPVPAWPVIMYANLEDPIKQVYPPIQRIQRVVAQYYRVTVKDICSPRRTKDIVRPRMVAAYLCKKFTDRSYPEIGRRFGRRDHTTILHSIRVIESLKDRDADLNRDLCILSEAVASDGASIEVGLALGVGRSLEAAE